MPISPKTGEPVVRDDDPGLPVTRAEAAALDAGREVLPAPACDCPRLSPADWDGVESDWSDIAFLQAHIKAVAGVPVGYARLQADLRERAASLGGCVPEDAMLLLGPGRFRRPLLLEVEDVPDPAKGVVRPGGVAYSRLVFAPWGGMQRAVDETNDAARERFGRDPSATYVWYLTCRQCSSARNYETLVVAHYPQAPD